VAGDTSGTAWAAHLIAAEALATQSLSAHGGSVLAAAASALAGRQGLADALLRAGPTNSVLGTAADPHGFLTSAVVRGGTQYRDPRLAGHGAVGDLPPLSARSLGQQPAAAAAAALHAPWREQRLQRAAGGEGDDAAAAVAAGDDDDADEAQEDEDAAAGVLDDTGGRDTSRAFEASERAALAAAGVRGGHHRAGAGEAAPDAAAAAQRLDRQTASAAARQQPRPALALPKRPGGSAGARGEPASARGGSAVLGSARGDPGGRVKARFGRRPPIAAVVGSTARSSEPGGEEGKQQEEGGAADASDAQGAGGYGVAAEAGRPPSHSFDGAYGDQLAGASPELLAAIAAAETAASRTAVRLAEGGAASSSGGAAAGTAAAGKKPQARVPGAKGGAAAAAAAASETGQGRGASSAARLRPAASGLLPYATGAASALRGASASSPALLPPHRPSTAAAGAGRGAAASASGGPSALPMTPSERRQAAAAAARAAARGVAAEPKPHLLLQQRYQSIPALSAAGAPSAAEAAAAMVAAAAARQQPPPSSSSSPHGAGAVLAAPLALAPASATRFTPGEAALAGGAVLASSPVASAGEHFWPAGSGPYTGAAGGSGVRAPAAAAAAAGFARPASPPRQHAAGLAPPGPSPREAARQRLHGGGPQQQQQAHAPGLAALSPIGSSSELLAVLAEIVRGATGPPVGTLAGEAAGLGRAVLAAPPAASTSGDGGGRPGTAGGAGGVGAGGAVRPGSPMSAAQRALHGAPFATRGYVAERNARLQQQQGQGTAQQGHGQPGGRSPSAVRRGGARAAEGGKRPDDGNGETEGEDDRTAVYEDEGEGGDEEQKDCEEGAAGDAAAARGRDRASSQRQRQRAGRRPGSAFQPSAHAADAGVAAGAAAALFGPHSRGAGHEHAAAAGQGEGGAAFGSDGDREEGNEQWEAGRGVGRPHRRPSGQFPGSPAETGGAVGTRLGGSRPGSAAAPRSPAQGSRGSGGGRGAGEEGRPQVPSLSFLVKPVASQAALRAHGLAAAAAALPAAGRRGRGRGGDGDGESGSGGEEQAGGVSAGGRRRLSLPSPLPSPLMKEGARALPSAAASVSPAPASSAQGRPLSSQQQPPSRRRPAVWLDTQTIRGGAAGSGGSGAGGRDGGSGSEGGGAGVDHSRRRSGRFVRARADSGSVSGEGRHGGGDGSDGEGAGGVGGGASLVLSPSQLLQLQRGSASGAARSPATRAPPAPPAAADAASRAGRGASYSRQLAGGAGVAAYVVAMAARQQQLQALVGPHSGPQRQQQHYSQRRPATAGAAEGGRHARSRSGARGHGAEGEGEEPPAPSALDAGPTVHLGAHHSLHAERSPGHRGGGGGEGSSGSPLPSSSASSAAQLQRQLLQLQGPGFGFSLPPRPRSPATGLHIASGQRRAGSPAPAAFSSSSSPSPSSSPSLLHAACPSQQHLQQRAWQAQPPPQRDGGGIVEGMLSQAELAAALAGAGSPHTHTGDLAAALAASGSVLYAPPDQQQLPPRRGAAGEPLLLPQLLQGQGYGSEWQQGSALSGVSAGGPAGGADARRRPVSAGGASAGSGGAGVYARPGSGHVRSVAAQKPRHPRSGPAPGSAGGDGFTAQGQHLVPRLALGAAAPLLDGARGPGDGRQGQGAGGGGPGSSDRYPSHADALDSEGLLFGDDADGDVSAYEAEGGGGAGLSGVGDGPYDGGPPAPLSPVGSGGILSALMRAAGYGGGRGVGGGDAGDGGISPDGDDNGFTSWGVPAAASGGRGGRASGGTLAVTGFSPPHSRPSSSHGPRVPHLPLQELPGAFAPQAQHDPALPPRGLDSGPGHALAPSRAVMRPDARADGHAGPAQGFPGAGELLHDEGFAIPPASSGRAGGARSRMPQLAHSPFAERHHPRPDSARGPGSA